MITKKVYFYALKYLKMKKLYSPFFLRTAFVVLFMLSFVRGWGQTATVSLRPTHIDVNSITSESAVLMTSANYSSNDARYRIFNGSNQYYCWDGTNFVTSNSYAAGPQIPGTPATSVCEKTTVYFIKNSENISII